MKSNLSFIPRFFILSILSIPVDISSGAPQRALGGRRLSWLYSSPSHLRALSTPATESTENGGAGGPPAQAA